MVGVVDVEVRGLLLNRRGRPGRIVHLDEEFPLVHPLDLHSYRSEFHIAFLWCLAR